MKIKIEEARKLCEDALIKYGFPKNEIKTIVDEYIDSELQGKLSHGLIAFPSLVDRTIIPKEKWAIEKEAHTAVFIDGKNNFTASNPIRNIKADTSSLLKATCPFFLASSFLRGVADSVRSS